MTNLKAENMEANEIKIGSMVKHIDMGDTMTVTGIMQESTGTKVFGITEYEIYCNGWIEHLEPIPLTEDWLIRFGFENDEITWSIKILLTTDEMAVLMLSKTKVGYAVSLNFISNPIANVEYVHTFQNLIHAITGTELTLTEPK